MIGDDIRSRVFRDMLRRSPVWPEHIVAPALIRFSRAHADVNIPEHIASPFPALRGARGYARRNVLVTTTHAGELAPRLPLMTSAFQCRLYAVAEVP